VFFDEPKTKIILVSLLQFWKKGFSRNIIELFSAGCHCLGQVTSKLTFFASHLMPHGHFWLRIHASGSEMQRFLPSLFQDISSILKTNDINECLRPIVQRVFPSSKCFIRCFLA